MSDPVTRLNAALQGRYAIERELGAGGMATVYLADDLKHERNVALKVLKPELAAVVGAERFLAEIKTTANLQHPHILPLHDSGEADGFLYYVMPYVEGETLRDRLDRDRQLPVDEAVRIATAVANALDHAHRNGVIHRDIKPANILLQDGEPVVADFGIALAVGAAGGARLTETGLSVGTPFYMSPEQATGDQVVGPSSDTYSLGSVLFEMLVGEPPYPGATAQAVLGKIIMGKPVSATEQRPAIPANIDGAVRCALEKLPADRFASAQDFGKALNDPGFRYGDAAEGTTSAVRGSSRWVVGALAIAAAGFAGAFAWSASRPEVRPVVRFELTLPEEARLSAGSGVNLAVSADGTVLLYRGRDGIMLRDLAHLETRLVQGTQFARNPVFSPDGRSLAFSSQGSLQTISLLGGPPTTIVEEGVPDGGGGVDWGEDGMLYFVSLGDIQAVPATGGRSLTIAAPDQGSKHAWVEALPGGRGLFFTITKNSPLESQIAVHDLESGETRMIIQGTTARYASSGHIVFAVANGALYSAPFDLDRLEITGPQVAMGETVDVYTGSASQFAISESGTLFYIAGQAGNSFTPMWVDRDGGSQAIDPDWTVQGGAGGGSLSLALSPDGTRLVISSASTRNTLGTDLWIKQLDSGPLSRLTFEGLSNHRPFWFGDGSLVAFISDRGGRTGFWKRRADGSDTPELMFAQPELWEGTFSPDEDWLVFRENSSGPRNIRARRFGIDSTDVDLFSSPASEWGADISPDGKWIAYVSSESGSEEVYVRPFPDVDQGRWLISTGGARSPIWAQSGEELFFRTLAGHMMSAEISLRPSFSVLGSPRLLFEASTFELGNSTVLYDVTRDDERFVMFSRADGGTAGLFFVTQNWTEELKARTAN